MKLVCSAIKFYIVNDKYPTIMCGKRHCNILEKMFNMNIKYDRNTVVQGFLTDDNTFVDRYKAFQIAMENNQLLPKAKEEYKDCKSTALYSEDVW